GTRQPNLKTSLPPRGGQARSKSATAPTGRTTDALHTFNRIQGLRREQRFVEAARVARELTTVDPKSAVGWHLLGVLLRETGETSQSVSPLLKALALQPGNVAIYADLSATLQVLKQS